jgi:hypothetical protein
MSSISLRIRNSLIFILVLALSFSSCTQKNDEQIYAKIETHVVMVNIFGNLVLEVSSQDLLTAGYAYGDIVHIELGDLKMDMPFTDEYLIIGSWGTCLNQYSNEKYLTLSLFNASFSDRIGGKVGDSVTISMHEKGGVLDVYEQYKKINFKRSDNRDDYASDEIFANFRMVTAGDIKSDKIYRSSKPTMNKSNNNRYLYSDNLARTHKVKTMISFSDSQSKWGEENSNGNGIGPYSLELYNNNSLFLSALGVDFFQTENLEILHDAMIFMINHEAPYLVFCDLGKDRTGIFFILIELLLNASYQEVEYDYLKSYDNFYGINNDSPFYSMIKNTRLDRLLYIIYHQGDLDIIKLNEIKTFNVEKFFPELKNVVKSYFINKVGLTENELLLFTNKLTNS